MQSRLILALFLSMIVMGVWSIFFAPKPAPKQDQAASQVEAPAEPASAAAQDTAPAVEAELAFDVEAASAPETLTLQFGTVGEPGHYHATFSNVGGRLVELRMGESFDQVRLSEAARENVEHRIELPPVARAILQHVVLV